MMNDKIFEHSITFSWVRFARKDACQQHTEQNIMVQVDERRARIVNPAEKSMDAAGIEPVTSR
jgi:hypothetical protein